MLTVTRMKNATMIALGEELKAVKGVLVRKVDSLARVLCGVWFCVEIMAFWSRSGRVLVAFWSRSYLPLGANRFNYPRPVVRKQCYGEDVREHYLNTTWKR